MDKFVTFPVDEAVAHGLAKLTAAKRMSRSAFFRLLSETLVTALDGQDREFLRVLDDRLARITAVRGGG